jgi:hypothetical protein
MVSAVVRHVVVVVLCTVLLCINIVTQNAYGIVSFCCWYSFYSRQSAGVSLTRQSTISLTNNDSTDMLQYHVVRCADSCQRTSLQFLAALGIGLQYSAIGTNLGLRHSVCPLLSLACKHFTLGPGILGKSGM